MSVNSFHREGNHDYPCKTSAEGTFKEKKLADLPSLNVMRIDNRGVDTHDERKMPMTLMALKLSSRPTRRIKDAGCRRDAG